MQPVILDQWSCAETLDTGSLDTGSLDAGAPDTGTPDTRHPRHGRRSRAARVTPACRPAA